MALLENLKIKNFRGFDSLEIEGLSQINLFVGQNNSGKTSILEAIFLLLGMSNPMLPSTVNQLRGLQGLDFKNFRYIFHNIDTQHIPVLNATFDDKIARELTISAIHTVNADQSINVAGSSLAASEITGLDVKFSRQKRGTQPKTLHSSLFLLEANGGVQQVKQIIPKDYHETVKATFIAPDRNENNTLTRLAEIVKKKNIRSVLSVLKAFDSRIIEMLPLPDGIFFNIDGTAELLPINIMGDGIKRFLNILSAVADNNNVVLIDEIENGLHYKAHTLLWENLIEFSKQSNIQLFITTHNIETLACLKTTLEKIEFENMRDYCKVFDIVKTQKKGFQAYRYSFEGFKDAIDHKTEIRY